MGPRNTKQAYNTLLLLAFQAISYYYSMRMPHIKIKVNERKIEDSKKVGYTLVIYKDNEQVEEISSSIDFFTKEDALDVGRLDAGQYIFDKYHDLLKSGEYTYSIE